MSFFDDSDYTYLVELEETWRKSLPRYTESEYLSIFPEAHEVIPVKISEYEEAQKQTIEIIENKLRNINKNAKNEEDADLLRFIVSLIDGEKLIKIEQHISRLRRLIDSNRHTYEKHLDIEAAMAIPIDSLFTADVTKLKKVGKHLVCNCPFHQDSNPSCYVYPETNSFYCFGCGKGGNPINYVMLSRDVDFVGAVKYLTANFL